MLTVLWANTDRPPGSLYQMHAEWLYSISIAGDAPVQEVKDGIKCDTCGSTECVSHWRAGIVALILFSFLMSNVKSETLMQHWGNAVQWCRTIIFDAPGLERRDAAQRGHRCSSPRRLKRRFQTCGRFQKTAKELVNTEELDCQYIKIKGNG